MQDEIIEALEEYYSTDRSTLIDCLFWLANHVYIPLNCDFTDYLNDEDICCHCGGELEPVFLTEIHTELEERPVEYVYSHRQCKGCGMCVD